MTTNSISFQSCYILFYKKLQKLLGHSNFPRKISAAVSGGADSTILALLLQRFAIENQINLTVHIINHNLRSESSQEATSVYRRIIDLGMQAHVSHIEWGKSKPISNLQELARIKRYKLLFQHCIDNDITHLFTGHQQDDQAETVLLRMIRGSGIDGLAAIPEISKRSNVHLVRPLLSFQRSSIEDILAQLGVQYLSDPSNIDQKFDRVKIRSSLPLLSQSLNIESNLLVKRLASLAENSSRSKSYIQSEVLAQASKLCYFSPLGTVLVDLEGFNKIHLELRLRLLKGLIMLVGGQFNFDCKAPRLMSLLNITDEIDFKRTIGGTDILIKSLQNLAGKKYSFLLIRRESGLAHKIPFLELTSQIIWDNRFLLQSDVKELFVGPVTALKLCKPILEQQATGIFQTIHKKQLVEIQIAYKNLICTPMIYNSERKPIFHPILNPNSGVKCKLLKPTLAFEEEIGYQSRYDN